MSKEHIKNIFGMAYRVKVKLLGHHESNVQLPKREYARAATAISTTAATTSTNTTLTLQLLLLPSKLL